MPCHHDHSTVGRYRSSTTYTSGLHSPEWQRVLRCRLVLLRRDHLQTRKSFSFRLILVLLFCTLALVGAARRRGSMKWDGTAKWHRSVGVAIDRRGQAQLQQHGCIIHIIIIIIIITSQHAQSFTPDKQNQHDLSKSCRTQLLWKYWTGHRHGRRAIEMGLSLFWSVRFYSDSIRWCA